MAGKVVSRAKLDPEQPESMSFDKAYEAATEIIYSSDAMEAFRNPTEKYENAIIDLAKRVEVPKRENVEVAWDIAAPVAVTAPATREEGIELITKRLDALTLPLQTMQATVNNLSLEQT